MKKKIYFLVIFIVTLLGRNALAQNAITLDPNTNGTNQARTLSEGVGSNFGNLYLYKTAIGAGWIPSKIGMKSLITIPTSDIVTGIYSLADKSSTTNYGIYGGAGAEGTASSFGGRFAGFGSTTNTVYGLISTATNRSSGYVYGGQFSIDNYKNLSNYRYGLSISNSTNTNDTTRARGRYGLSVYTNGKVYNGYSLIGIQSLLSNSQVDTVTNNATAYAIYSYSSIKNNYSNIGILANASNYGTGPSIGGIFSANFGGVNTANGSRRGIEASAISSNYDTVTVLDRYGVYARVNGHTKYNNYAVFGENGNIYGDTLTAINRTGVYGSATGKSKYSSYGVYGNSSSIGNNSAYGVYGSAFSNNTATGSVRGIYGSAYNSGTSGATFGGEFYANNGNINNNNSKFGIYATVFQSHTSNSALISGASVNAYSSGNNSTQGVNANAYGTSTSSGIIKSINATAGSDNTGNTNPTYGIYTTALGNSPGIKYGIFATSSGNGGQFAGYFQGNVHINGTLSKSGGTFKIDHPQDPENKYLMHSFVESPEMKNIYDGTTTTDVNGDATIMMPSYFQSLNITFRYQLTCIGQFAQAIVSEEISSNSFKIKTDKPNIKVSWQVTGVRNDPWAQANPIVVEQAKTNTEKGKYLNPVAYKKAENMGIHALTNTNNQTAAEREIEAKAMQNKMEHEQKQRDEQQTRQLTENLKEKAEVEQAEKHRQADQKRREEETAKNAAEVKNN